MICANCGAKLKNGESYCPVCGQVHMKADDVNEGGWWLLIPIGLSVAFVCFYLSKVCNVNLLDPNFLKSQFYMLVQLVLGTLNQVLGLAAPF